MDTLRQKAKRRPPRAALTAVYGLLLLAVVSGFLSCRPQARLPVLALDFTKTGGEIKLTDWAVVGPFKINGPRAAGDASDSSDAGIDRDFLTLFGRSEAGMGAEDFLKLDKGVWKGSDLPADFATTNVHAAKGVVRFDRLFETKSDAVAYSACVIESQSEAEVLLASGADDCLKVWLNGEPVLRMVNGAAPGQPAYGNLGQDGRLTTLKLKRGRNFLLVKVSQVERMWGFNCSLLTLEAARELSRADELHLNDVVERSLLPRGAALSLHHDLSALLRNLREPLLIEVLNAGGEKLISADVDSQQDWGRPLGGLPDGLYLCRLTCPLFKLEEPFYYGDADAALSAYQRRYDALQNLDEQTKIDFQALAIRRDRLFGASDRPPPDKTWQKKVVYLLGEFESLLAHSAPGAEASRSYPGTHLRGYRSKVDGQVQYYMVHVPAGGARTEQYPLVVIVPYPVPTPHPFLNSVFVANIDLISSYVKLADRYGYALLWPFARGNSDGTPIAMTDIFEAMKAAQADYDFDERRVYLLGWSFGGTYSLLLGARFPGRFAAIGAVMPPTDLVELERASNQVHSPYPPAWLKLNSPAELAEGLSNTPLYLVHGDEDEVVPPRQSAAFVERCRELGFDAKLDIIEGMDHAYCPADPNSTIFAFFQGRVLNPRPENISFATGQLKYDTAYWLRVSQLSRPATIGRIHASLTSQSSIAVETEGVSRYEILLDALGHPQGQPLSVSTNGRVSFNGVPDGSTVRIDVEGDARPGALQKNHDIEGPISHAFADSFTVVEGTGGSREVEAGIEDLSQKIRATWMQNYFAECPHKKDSEVTPEDIESSNLILLGDAKANQLVERTIAGVPLRIEAGRISLGGREFDGGKLGVELIYPNPLNNRKYIVVIAANSADAYQYLESHLSQKGWYDFAVWDASAPQRAKVVAAGFWDRWWEQVELVANAR